MKFFTKNNAFLIFFLAVAAVLYTCFVFLHFYQNSDQPISLKNTIDVSAIASFVTSGKETIFNFNNAAAGNTIVSQKPLKNPPEIIQAVYVTGWSAGSKNYLAYLDTLFKTTTINAVVIDIKDYSGMVSYKTGATKAKEYNAYQSQIKDIDSLIKSLHQKGIYVIGRIVVFQDPVLAKKRPELAIYSKSKTIDPAKPILWEDDKGFLWLDPSSKEVQDYNIAIAKDAALHGFDEINFDYVRFPSSGDTKDMEFPLWNQKNPGNIVIKDFFKKIGESFQSTKISVDVFGQTTTNTDDLGIGQIFEDALSYVDYICPMIYPSHYATGFLGYQKPSEYPYHIVKNALDNALDRQKIQAALGTQSQPAKLAKIRPWLQDFSFQVKYTPVMVAEEIQATKDALGEDFKGFMLWNPSNIYSQEAIIKETNLN